MDRSNRFAPEYIEMFKVPEFRRHFEQECVLNAFADGIEQAMKKAGLTQKELAAKTGRSAQALSRALHGSQNLTVGTMIELAFALGCTLDLKVEPLAEMIPLVGEDVEDVDTASLEGPSRDSETGSHPGMVNRISASA